jgi:hypothetical protein
MEMTEKSGAEGQFFPGRGKKFRAGMAAPGGAGCATRQNLVGG